MDNRIRHLLSTQIVKSGTAAIYSTLVTFAILCFFAVPSARAQQTVAVTATVVDPNGLPYSNASVSATLVPNAPGGFTVNNAQINGTFNSTLDVNGVLSMNLFANSVIAPAATQYSFRICETPGIPPPAGFGSVCFTAGPITITPAGGSQSITTTLNAAALALSRIAGGGGGGSFSAITSGTNTTAAMVCGTGCSISTSGTGTISATPGGTINQLQFNSGGAPPVFSGTTATWDPVNGRFLAPSLAAATPTYSFTAHPNTGLFDSGGSWGLSAGGVFNLIGSTTSVTVGSGLLFSSSLYATNTNCQVNSVSPAACGSSAAGSFVLPAATTAYTVTDSAVKASSQIILMPHTDTRGLPGAPTCTVPLYTTAPVVTSVTAATNFIMAFASNAGQTCWDFWILN